MSRGDRREAIYRDDADRLHFLKTLGEACARTGWRVHAYVLMSNHYHLLLETPHANLVKGMHWFQSCYTLRFNARHRLSGHVFQGRYNAIPVEAHRDYLFPLADYIHLNPARAGVIAEGKVLLKYRWSSLPAYANLAKRPEWLECGSVLGELGSGDLPSTAQAYVKHVTKQSQEVSPESDPEELPSTATAWFVGSREFGQRLLERLRKGNGKAKRKRMDTRSGGEYGEAMAEEIVIDGLKEFEMLEEMLQTTPKSDWRKRIIGNRIRKQTSVALRWISERLKMGAVPRVSKLCAQVDDLQRKLKKVKK